jgi:hypothetical protein
MIKKNVSNPGIRSACPAQIQVKGKVAPVFLN